MPNPDLLWRSIPYPKDFQDGTLDIIAFMVFDDAKDGTGKYVLSVASGLEALADIHAYGCRTTQAQNEGFEKRKGRPPGPDEKRHYLGCYAIERPYVSVLPLDCYDVVVEHAPENGEEHHYHVSLVPREGVNVTDKTRKQDRLNARTYIAGLLQGPERHVCAVDAEMSEELMAIDIKRLPEACDLAVGQ